MKVLSGLVSWGSVVLTLRTVRTLRTLRSVSVPRLCYALEVNCGGVVLEDRVVLVYGQIFKEILLTMLLNIDVG